MYSSQLSEVLNGSDIVEMEKHIIESLTSLIRVQQLLKDEYKKKENEKEKMDHKIKLMMVITNHSVQH